MAACVRIGQQARSYSIVPELGILDSCMETSGEEFDANVAAMRKLEATLDDRHSSVAAGGSAKAVEKHRGRGKLLARERI